MHANILVVDDEPAIRELCVDWLAEQGYTCRTAGEAHEALDVAAHSPTDVALLDVMMPGEDGLWLARRLREADASLPMIMVTGVPRFDAAVEGMRLGVQDYLVKPFDRRQLVAAVDRAVRSRARVTTTARVDTVDSAAADELVAVDPWIDAAASGAVEALMAVMDSRDEDAGRHSRRVATMAVLLGQELGFERRALLDLERGALLHDIGKIALPQSLVHLPGSLSEAQVAIVRQHSQIGHDIVAGVSALAPIAEVVLSTHERWDGRGYPRGLSEEDIPHHARLIAVVDAFDALTSARAYRGAVTPVEAATEIVRHAGTQFDPEVVRTWLRVLDRPGVLAFMDVND